MQAMNNFLRLRRPDDWHLHLRDQQMLAAVAPWSAGLGRAIIMPNLVPPVVTGTHAAEYRARILAALPENATLRPLMTLYLTETTDPADVLAAHGAGIIAAVKLYPAGATTNSASGVRDFDRVRPVFEAMAEAGIPLCVHGEVTDPSVDIFDREAVFIDRVLDPIRRATPGLRVVMEHVTTKDGVDYVRAGGDIGATITTHHLVINRNHILAGGIRPHYYCLPVAKRESHRLALVEAATSGDPRFFSGTDSAPPPFDAHRPVTTPPGTNHDRNRPSRTHASSQAQPFAVISRASRRYSSSARSAEVCRAGLVPAKTDRSTARAQKARILCFAISLGPPSHRAAVMAPMEAPATRRTGSSASSSTSIAP